MGILFTWIGDADFDGVEKGEPGREGPIVAALEKRSYEQVILFNSRDENKGYKYKKALRIRFNNISFTVKKCILSSPMAMAEIYRHVEPVVRKFQRENVTGSKMSFHISPGTSAMAAIWILLSKTQYAAELIQSSLERGVEIMDVPFSITDFRPELIKQPSDAMARIVDGMTEEGGFERIKFESHAMAEVVTQAKKLLLWDIPVLIKGQSGTGKELFARAIHEDGARARKPFIAVNCGAIPPELLESELFGHERGAFTGADRPRKGAFREADKGTIFLDEIGEMPIAQQVKLLRVLQEGEVTPIGSNKTVKVDVRVLAATNVNLQDAIANNKFREDLYYRLAVALLAIPSLEKRPGDISLLIEHELAVIEQKWSAHPEWSPKSLTEDAKKFLVNAAWPGNVRELQNTLVRAVIQSDGKYISIEDVKKAKTSGQEKTFAGILERELTPDFILKDVVNEVERFYITKALRESANKTVAAEKLGYNNYQSLDNKMKKLALE